MPLTQDVARTQNTVKYWQLRSGLSIEQAAQRIGVSLDGYRAVVVFGNDRFTQDEIRQVLTAADIDEGRLPAWEKRLGAILGARLRGRITFTPGGL